jgi:hypothetical protein
MRFGLLAELAHVFGELTNLLDRPTRLQDLAQLGKRLLDSGDRLGQPLELFLDLVDTGRRPVNRCAN